MKISKWLVHALTIVSFPLQLVPFAILGVLYARFTFSLTISIIAHLFYFLRVIRNGETRFRRQFFYYEVVVAVLQLLVFYSNYKTFLGLSSLFFLIPLAVQVTTCYSLFAFIRQSEEEGMDLYDEEKDDRFKKGVVNTMIIIAFPTQLFSFACFYVNNFDQFPTSFALSLFILSIFIHICYYIKAVRWGQHEYKDHFFSFEVGVLLVQAYAHFLRPFIYYYFLDFYWCINYPSFVQVCVCCALYFYSEKCTLSAGLPSYIEVVREKQTEFPVYPVEEKKEIVCVA